MRCLLLALALMGATTANAQQFCQPYPALRQRLLTEFGEVPVGGGVIGDTGLVVQLFASPGGETFTILTIEGPVACVLAGGNDWINKDIPAKGERGA